MTQSQVVNNGAKEKSEPVLQPTKGTQKVVTLLLKEIHADYNYNCRSTQRTQLKGAHITVDDPEAPGVEGLARSMQLDGQRTPVDVAPVKGGYELRAGFRRYTAAKLLADNKQVIAGLANGEIRVTVHEGLTADEQRLLNISENVSREQLTPPDLVFAMLQLKGITQKEIAERLGKSQPYVSNLLKVGEALKPSILTQWRQAASPLALSEMQVISAKKQEDQDAAYLAACNPPQEDEKTKDKAWVTSACNRAKKIGAVLGELQREGMLTVGAKTIDGDVDNMELVEADLALFTLFVRNMVKFKVKEAGGKEVSKARVKKIADAAFIAYNAQLAAKGDTSGDEEEEEDEN